MINCHLTKILVSFTKGFSFKIIKPAQPLIFMSRLNIFNESEVNFNSTIYWIWFNGFARLFDFVLHDDPYLFSFSF